MHSDGFRLMTSYSAMIEGQVPAGCMVRALELVPVWCSVRAQDLVLVLCTVRVLNLLVCCMVRALDQVLV